MADFKISLKACRVNAGLTQIELAKKVGVCPKTIKNWENNKTSPQITQLEIISQITKVPLQNIFIPVSSLL